MTVNIHCTCVTHLILLQCIFVGEFGRLLAPHHSQANCVKPNPNRTVELNISLVYCVVQSNFMIGSYALSLTLELKGLSLIYLHNYESAVFINHILARIS